LENNIFVFLNISMIAMKYLLLPAFLLSATSLSAQLIDLDPDFNTDGVFEYIEAEPYDDSPEALFIQPGGKIVAAGSLYLNIGSLDFGIMRFTTDGNLDNTFDTDGIVTNDFGLAHNDVALASTMLSDGKFYLSGSSVTNFGAIAKYNTNGTLDNAFSTDGWMPVPDMMPIKIVVQSNGAILIIDNGMADFWVRRYTSGGAIDNTFDSDGEVILDFEGTSNWNNAVCLDADQKILLAGRAYIQSDYDFAIARLNSNGSLDNTFGNGGKVTVSNGTNTDEIFFITTQSDGKILVAGNTSDGQESNIMVTRLHADGSLDNTYGTGGITVIDVDVEFAGAVVQNDGKIIVTGNAYNSSTNDYTQIFMARLNADGTLDQTFASGGWFLKPATNYLENATTITLQSDGKILVGAKVKQLTDDKTHWAIYRYTNNFTAIEENTFDATDITVYPNPANTKLTLNTEWKIDNGKLTIMNATGQEVLQLSIVNYQLSINNSPLSIDVSQLASGIYHLNISNEEQTVSKKFVKE
jgi:uncharacterized delta-60 repeat protein